MGRLAERLSRRSHPLYQPAKELAQAAARCFRGEDDEGDLPVMLEENLGSLDPDAFETLLALTMDEVELFDEPEEVLQELMSVLRDVCEEVDDGTGRLVALFAMPVRVATRKSASRLPAFSDGQVNDACDLLREYEFVSEDADVSLCPWFLGAAEVDQMRWGEVFSLTRALSGDDIDEVREILDRVRARVGQVKESARPRSPVRESFRVLVGLTATEEEVPFVLASILDVEHEHLSAFDREKLQRQHMELHEDAERYLGRFAKALGEILDISEVRVDEPPNYFSANRTDAYLLERDQQALAHLHQLAEEHCGGRLQELAVGKPDIEGDTMVYGVLRKSDGVPLGVLRWTEGSQEPWQESMHRFVTVIDAHGVAVQFERDEFTGEGPLH